MNRVVGNNSITSNPTIPSPSLVPHDFVDLTEDDDHDHRHDLVEAKNVLKPPVRIRFASFSSIYIDECLFIGTSYLT